MDDLEKGNETKITHGYVVPQSFEATEPTSYSMLNMSDLSENSTVTSEHTLESVQPEDTITENMKYSTPKGIIVRKYRLKK
jgi:hypothetical protein